MSVETTDPLEALAFAPARRFVLVDDRGRPGGVFVTRADDWRVGDWILTDAGRRARILRVDPPPWGCEDIAGLWVVEPA